MTDRARVVLLTGTGDVSNAVHNALRDDVEIARIIVESPVPRSELLRRRARRLGLRKVAGQVAFGTLVLPVLARRSRDRIEEIRREHAIDLTAPPAHLVRRIESVNAPGTSQLVTELSPSLVIIHGTRILSKALLRDLPRVLNIHAGITPRYRGVHGGYWALAEGDPLHCGVTVHLVDPGIDTGGILAQERIRPGPRDNFVTYPYLQLGVGLRLLRQCVRDLLANRLEPRTETAAPSKIWSHPTLFEYAANRLRTGTK